MLQAVLFEPGRAGLVEKPEPRPERGELLIRVKAALTCGTDLKAYLRGHPAIPMPGPFGHEFSGVVAAVGRGVRGFREGDSVMAVHTAPCRKCGYCRRGLENLCEDIMKTKVLGAYADYVLLPSHIVSQNVYPKPRGLGFEEAALLEPLSCVVHSVWPLGVRRGARALVLGAGPIGLLHAMLLKGRGAWTAVSDPNPARLMAAGRAGADLTINPSECAIKEELYKAAPGGVDYVFECTGRPEVWEDSVNYVRRGGTVVLFGGCPPGTRAAFDTERLHYDEVTLKGTFHFRPDDVKKAYSLLKAGRLGTKGLISGSCPLSEFDSALKRLVAGEGLKYAILP